MNWQKIRNTLLALGKHRFMPPCLDERINWVEQNWGALPPDLRSMLELFNGAELFIDAIPFLTMLGISTNPPQNQIAWPRVCCLDYWLERGLQSRGGWPIARSNYGSLWILQDNMVVEWGQAGKRWLDRPRTFPVWMDGIIDEGAKYITEAK